jgi:hypothetical protein
MRISTSTRFGLHAVACGMLWFVSACTEHEIEGADYQTSGGGPPYDTVTLYVNDDVDILFVVDNSGSMAEEQGILAASFGSFIEVLERPDVAADYRIGITTTDNGNPWCDTTGAEAGKLRLTSCRSRSEEFTFDGTTTIEGFDEACAAACPAAWTDIEIEPTAVMGQDGLRARNWLESVAGRTNLPEGLSTTQALQCVAPQGIDGCGFESHLESMWKTLRRSYTDNDEDMGFIRDNAILSVVHVTDEADCSYNGDWETIFLPDGNRVFWSDPEATSPTSAVCWNAGVTCEGLGAGTYDDCHSIDLDVEGNEVAAADADDLAVLRPMSRYIDILQEFEENKQHITPFQEVLVSLIGGVGADGSATYQDAADDPVFQQDFGIGAGCASSYGRAVPPVRLRELAEAFAVGDDRNMFSVCESDYSAALASIAESIADQIKPACMPVCVADTDRSTTDVVDPACNLTQEWATPDGGFEQLEILPCEEGDALPEGQDVCYVTLVGDALSDFCDDYGFNLEFRFVRRTGVPGPAGAAILGTCERSQDKATDCPDLP